MKNLHVLPTDHPSRLRYNIKTRIWELNEFHKYHTDIKSTHNIYITSDEEIKMQDWCITAKGNLLQMIEGDTALGFALLGCKKIILTTDPHLIEKDVQPINEVFLNWFIKNPSCEEVAIDFSLVSGSFKYKIIIPSSEIWKDIPEFEGYEEALNQFPEYNQYLERIAFEKGVEWQQERSYNEEELRKIVKYAFNAGQRAESGKISKDFTLNRYLNSLKRNNGKKNK